MEHSILLLATGLNCKSAGQEEEGRIGGTGRGRKNRRERLTGVSDKYLNPMYEPGSL
jgi:hypothetical protein